MGSCGDCVKQIVSQCSPPERLRSGRHSGPLRLRCGLGLMTAGICGSCCAVSSRASLRTHVTRFQECCCLTALAEVPHQESPSTRETPCVRAQSWPTLGDPMNCSLPGPFVRGIFHKEHWSGLSFPLPEDLPNSGLNLCLLHRQADSLPLGHLGSPR